MDNTSLLASARRRWWIIVVLALAGAVLGAIPQPERVEEQVVRYQATHTMLQNQDVLDTQTQTPLISASQIGLFATAGEVPARAAAELNYPGGAAILANDMSVFYDFSTGALTVTTVQDSARRAEQVADVYAITLNSYLVERQDQVYRDRLNAVLTRLDELERELTRLSTQVALNPNDPVIEAQRGAVARQYGVAFEQSETLSANPNILSFTTLQRAQAIPLADSGISAPTSRLARAAMGGVLGAAVGIAVAMLLGLLDRRIRTREQIESLLGMRARVLIHRTRKERAGGIVVAPGRHDPLSDAYRTTRNVVGFIYTGMEPVARGRITVVVSPGPGDGKTSMAANLAAAFAEMGQRTVVVNTDFRRPKLSRVINGSAVSPSAFHLSDLDTLDPAWLLRETPVNNLMLLDLAGMGSAGELAAATARLLPRLAQQFDAVVVDTSPVAATAEVLDIVPVADLIVMVARLGHTRIEASERALSVLKDTTAAPIVLALTGALRERAGYYEYTDRRARPDEGEKVRTRWRRGKSAPYTGPERRRTERRLSELSVSPSARRQVYRPGPAETRQVEPRLFDAVEADTGAEVASDSNGHVEAPADAPERDGPPTAEQIVVERSE